MISTKKKIVFAAIPVALVLLVVYLGYVVYRSKLHYDDLKTAPHYSPRLFNADEELGYATVPGYRGALVVDGRFRVPAFHDANGFRVDGPESGSRAGERPVILTLGDSFSYGFGLEAEETYAHLVAEAVGGTLKNASGNGYGLAQMLILARRHIPARKPDYVLVQYSRWIVARAGYPFAPTTLVTVPVPYFYESEGKINLAPPYFRARAHDLPISEYCETEASIGNFLSFLVRVGIPLRAHDDVQMGLLGFRKAAGLVPAPTKNYVAIENRFYREVAKLCREHGARMLVVAIGNWEGTTGLRSEMLPEGEIGVRADLGMIRVLPETSRQTFVDRYAIFWGETMNLHHNAAGNRIIADAVLEGIRHARETGERTGQGKNGEGVAPAVPVP